MTSIRMKKKTTITNNIDIDYIDDHIKQSRNTSTIRHIDKNVHI